VTAGRCEAAAFFRTAAPCSSENHPDVRVPDSACDDAERSGRHRIDRVLKPHGPSSTRKSSVQMAWHASSSSLSRSAQSACMAAAAERWGCGWGGEKVFGTAADQAGPQVKG